MTEREIERRARELLAAEYRAERYEDAALRAEQGSLLHPADKAAIRAIIAALESLSPPEGAEKLRADLAKFDWEITCEGCGAPLFDGDDFVSDPDGCHGCWFAMTELPSKRERPCYAYRVGKPDARQALSTFPGGGATGGGEERG